MMHYDLHAKYTKRHYQQVNQSNTSTTVSIINNWKIGD